MKQGNLASKLTSLQQKGVIDARLYEWADALRLAGNDAAHGDDPDLRISKEDADDLLTFTEAIIDYVYMYRARFDEFLRRKAKREAKAGPAKKRAPKKTAAKKGAARKAPAKKAPAKGPASS